MPVSLQFQILKSQKPFASLNLNLPQITRIKQIVTDLNICANPFNLFKSLTKKLKIKRFLNCQRIHRDGILYFYTQKRMGVSRDL